MLRTLAILAAAAILIANLLAIGGLSGRPMHYDENEYLHASWLVAAGRTIYRDFFEDHPPHFFLMLQSVMPGGELRDIDVQLWTVRSRWLAGLFGTVAVSGVMLFAWRITRAPVAPVVAAAALVASAQIWSRGLADIRAEAPSLALFWMGVVLLTWSREISRLQAMRAGTGIGLLFFAAVMNPKWPLECAVMGAYFLRELWRLRRWLVTAIAPGLAIAVVALMPIFTITTPADYLFFNFRLKAAVVDDFTSNPWIVDFFTKVPVWSTASLWHRWWAVLLGIGGAGLFAWGDRRRRSATDEEQVPAHRSVTETGGDTSVSPWIAVALAVSALVEFRFFYPYPYLWAQYLVMIATTASVAYALTAALLPRRVQMVVIVAVTIAAMVPLGRRAMSAFQAKPSSWERYWATQRMLQKADRVWISPPRHPVATFDASYYWYNFRESAPSAIRLREKYSEFLPPIALVDLPPCRLVNVQYVELGDWMPFLDGVCSCAESAFNSGRLVPAEPMAIFAVDARLPPAAWGVRTAGLWADLCNRQEVFLRGGQLNISP